MVIGEKIKIMKDKNVDMKKLKDILSEYNSEFEIFEANIENLSRKIEQKPALAVLGTARFPMRLGGQTSVNNFDNLKLLIGNENSGDALQVSEADYHKADFFITEDGDILSKKEGIKSMLPNLKITNLEEFKDTIKNQNILAKSSVE